MLALWKRRPASPEWISGDIAAANALLVRREFDTEIVDQLLEERIAWRTVSGDTKQMGMVHFQRLDDAHTRVELVMDVEPTGAAEKAASAVGMIDRRVNGDIRRFKELIEQRGGESGSWRGRVSPD
ncbi:SRPBCC family protein [Streptomyces sp. NPDC048479]|uniref:SRPBCC family protein n=1 Tax=Streptomyces sp. NPDC048479 TaxID=3154725 RepID=UPI00341D3EAB